jgi:hypothetical protein
MEEVEGLSPSSSTKFEGINFMPEQEQPENNHPVLGEDTSYEWTPKRFPDSKPRTPADPEATGEATTEPHDGSQSIGAAVVGRVYKGWD